MDYLKLIEWVVDQALRQGLGDVEVYLEWGEDTHVEVRMGKIELVQQSHYRG